LHGWDIRYVASPTMYSKIIRYNYNASFYSVGFADKANQDVASILVAEVKPHLPDVPSVTINLKVNDYLIYNHLVRLYTSTSPSINIPTVCIFRGLRHTFIVCQVLTALRLVENTRQKLFVKGEKTDC